MCSQALDSPHESDWETTKTEKDLLTLLRNITISIISVIKECESHSTHSGTRQARLSSTSRVTIATFGPRKARDSTLTWGTLNKMRTGLLQQMAAPKPEAPAKDNNAAQHWSQMVHGDGTTVIIKHIHKNGLTYITHYINMPVSDTYEISPAFSMT